MEQDNIKQDVMTKTECKMEIDDTLDSLNTVQRNIATLSNLKKILAAKLVQLQSKYDQMV